MKRTKKIAVTHNGVGNSIVVFNRIHRFFEKTQIPPTPKTNAPTIIPTIAECKSEKTLFKYTLNRFSYTAIYL